MGTWEGGGIPLCGGYTAYLSNGTTSYLTVGASGTYDFSFSAVGADNYISITTADTAALTSGYLQHFYGSLTHTGGVSSGAQLNPFAADMTIGGTIAGEVSGAYIYIAESGTTAATMTNAILAGYTAYLNAFGSAATYRAGFHVYSGETSTYTATGLDAAFFAESAGTGTYGALLGYMGQQPPEYFFHSPSNIPWGATSRMIRILASDASSIVAQMRVYIYNTEYFIPLYATTCT